MKIKKLHIMTREKFINPYIVFINRNFENDNHLFLILGGDKAKKVDDFENVKYGKEDGNKILRALDWYKELIKKCYKSEKIMLHGLFNPLVILFLFTNPLLLKKCNWVIWGGDLYVYQKPKLKIKEKIYEFMRAICIKRFGGIVALSMGDFDLAKRWYKTKAKAHQGMYINPVDLKMLDKVKKIKNKEIVIQVGNSSDPSNNYEEIFEVLMKYKNEDIKIIAPLSYGDRKYAEKINKLGIEKFGLKFEGLMKFMKPEEYANHLSRVDVLIFNHKRQQGLGNIYALAYLNKKIYIRDDISSWNFLTKFLGFKINSFNNLSEESFKEFKEFNEIKNKKRALETVYTDKFIKKMWLEIFN